MKKVIIPKENLKDLRDIPKNILKGIEVVEVTHMDQVLRHAIEDQVFTQVPSGEPGAGKLPAEPIVEVPPAPVTAH